MFPPAATWTRIVGLRGLIYFIILELRLFYAFYIIVALIYSYRGGILASFLSSTVAVRLYLPIIL